MRLKKKMLADWPFSCMRNEDRWCPHELLPLPSFSIRFLVPMSVVPSLTAAAAAAVVVVVRPGYDIVR